MAKKKKSPGSPPEVSIPKDSVEEPKLDDTVPIDTDPIDDDPNATIDIDPNQKTIPGSQADSTTRMDESASEDSGNVSVFRGKDSVKIDGGGNNGVSDLQNDTTVNVQPRDAERTIEGDFSVMASSQIGKTVNPRELSDQDVAAWNSAVGDSDQVTDSSEIEGSYAEQQFQKLRRVDVAALKSDSGSAFDYRLVRKLGQGGMGDVFVARQGSLDRLLALKLIKPISGAKRTQLEKTGRLDSVEEERRQQFLSEAIVTGDLDHPNIVPIHDVGLTSDNQLFYAMKRVVGTPWSEVIEKKSLDENLEILLKAADAIGFAHTRGVVHRDIKPENIMLGDFGVVMVMDWGLALLTSEYEKQESITTTSGLGGTPAFMAPEMAIGPVDIIGQSSDIYLLGATLFMIVTGKPPHFAKNVTQCIQAVRANKIRDVPANMQGELLDVAMKAMATDPKDRYVDAERFQQAIRDYRSHAESISLANRATRDLDTGKQNQSYADLSRAAFGFEESIQSWNGNEKALRGLAETKIIHASAAYKNGDYDLGLSLLDDQTPEHAPILDRLREGIRERQSHSARLSLMRKVAIAMLAFIIIGGSIAIYTINREKQLAENARDSAVAANAEAEESRKRAVKAHQIAENERVLAEINEQEAILQEREAEKQRARAVAQRTEAQKQKLIAETERESAVAAKRDAELARDDARSAQQQADVSRRRAVYEEYVSKIGLAKARLERNEVDGAREILRQLKATSAGVPENWEWRWLWRQANQADSSQRTESPIIDLSIGENRRDGVVVLSSGEVRRFEMDQQGKITDTKVVTVKFSPNAKATSVAIASKTNRIAIGTNIGEIVLVDSESRTILRGHTATVSDLLFAADGVLVSGSHDKTVRLWDMANDRELTKNKACWHISPVQQIAIASIGSSMTLAVASADDSSGRIVLWNLLRRGDSIAITRSGTFDQHSRRPTAVAITDNGQRVASGDVGGNVFVWETKGMTSTDYARSLGNAISRVRGEATIAGEELRQSVRKIPVVSLVDRSSPIPRRLVSTARTGGRDRSAHDDQIRSIRFNSTGDSLLTASDDYTLKLWDLGDQRLRKTLTGHGGWVVGAEFLSSDDDVVISASSDATVRSWKPKTYVGSFVSARSQPQAESKRKADAHREEIWSASLSPDGSRVITASRDHTARVMRIDPDTLTFTDVIRLEQERLQEGSEFVAMSMQLDRKHRRLYVGSADATIRVWDFDRGVEVGRAPGTGLNTAFALSHDGKLLLSGSSSPDVKAILWRLDPTGTQSPRVLHLLKGHDQAVTAFAIAADSNKIFTGDRDGHGILWDAKSGESIGQPIDNVRGFRINAAQFSPNGSELLLATDDEQLTRIDIQSRKIVGRMNHDGAVTQLSVSSNGRHALTVSQWSTNNGLSTAATLWDLDTERPSILERSSAREDDRGERITSARFDESGKVASVSRAATSGSPAMVRLWDVTSADSASRARSQRSFHLPSVLGTAQVALPIEDQQMLTMNKNGVFRWKLNSKKLVTSYRSHAALTEASFSFDGKWIVTGSRSVKIWDAETGKAFGKIETPHSGPVRTIQFAPKPLGETDYVFATSGDDRIVRIWSWNDQTYDTKQLRQYDVDGAGGVIRRVRFSPDGKRLLIVGDAGVAQILEMQPQSEPIVFDTTDAGDFLCAAFSSDGTVIAVGSSDHRVRLWRVPKPGEALADPVILSGHADGVNDVKLIGQTGHGFRILTASADDTIRVWDPRWNSRGDGDPAGREILSLRRHTGDVMAIDATNNGGLVMTAGRDGVVILWPAGD